MAREISQAGRRPSSRKKRAPPTTAGEHSFPGKEDQQGSWQRGSQGATPLSCWWVGRSFRGILLQNTPVSYSSCRAGLKPPSLPRDTKGSCETLMGGPNTLHGSRSVLSAPQEGESPYSKHQPGGLFTPAGLRHPGSLAREIPLTPRAAPMGPSDRLQ